MKRVQRTVRLHPDLDKELRAKASGDVSVTEIIEGALARHFRREAVEVQIEHLTRKQSQMSESIDKLGGHQLRLQKSLDGIAGQLGEHRGVHTSEKRCRRMGTGTFCSSLLCMSAPFAREPRGAMRNLRCEEVWRFD